MNSDIQDMLSHLKDPATVFINMKRGIIAKPLFRSIAFLYANDEGFDVKQAIEDLKDACGTGDIDDTPENNQTAMKAMIE